MEKKGWGLYSCSILFFCALLGVDTQIEAQLLKASASKKHTQVVSSPISTKAKQRPKKSQDSHSPRLSRNITANPSHQRVSVSRQTKKLKKTQKKNYVKKRTLKPQPLRSLRPQYPIRSASIRPKKHQSRQNERNHRQTKVAKTSPRKTSSTPIAVSPVHPKVKPRNSFFSDVNKLAKADLQSQYSGGKAPFTVRLNQQRLNYHINSAFFLPGDEIVVDLPPLSNNIEYTITSTLGTQVSDSLTKWRWSAPADAGLYPLIISHPRTGKSVSINIFVLVPLEQVQDGHLNGYRIGSYPKAPLRNLAMYTLPRGFVEVTPKNENTLVSPHFRLGQFLCKQEGDYPKYLILDARLLTTLEALLELANTNGYYCRTFAILSAYRTPYYNRAIGNRTTYSRHLWGDAADIFIDENPRDGRMDDLNQDGVIDEQDAAVIYDLIDNAYEPRYQRTFLGGLAQYRETSRRGPFIHVDVRGTPVRWGIRNNSREANISPINLRSGGQYLRSQSSEWSSKKGRF